MENYIYEKIWVRLHCDEAETYCRGDLPQMEKNCRQASFYHTGLIGGSIGKFPELENVAFPATIL